MKIPHIAFLSILLAACAGGPPPQANLVYYDFSRGPAELSAPLRSLDVVPASWLASNAMYYRLSYADGNRREQYMESRWTAQPAELLSTRLQRSLINGNTVHGALLCRVRLDLDDLVQVFEKPGASHLVLEGRVTLYGPQQAVLARRHLNLAQPAGADARAAAAASGPLTEAVARELQDWVRQECKKPV